MPLTRKRFLWLAGGGVLGAAAYAVFGPCARCNSESRDYPCKLPGGKFTYKGKAVAIRGDIEEFGTLAEQAVAVLDPEKGGHNEGRVEGFAFHGVVYVDTAYSFVTGNPDCMTDPADAKNSVGVFRSTVTSRLNGLDVDGVVRADAIVANLESQQSQDHGVELDMVPVGYFTNLRIRGYQIDLHPPGGQPAAAAAPALQMGEYVARLMTKGRWSDMKDLPRDLDAIEKDTQAQAAAVKSTRCADPSHAPRLSGNRYETSIFSDQAIWLAVKDIPGVVACRGGRLHVRDLGDVFLGTFVVEEHLRTLTMIRVKLDSPPRGEVQFASVEGDGVRG